MKGKLARIVKLDHKSFPIYLPIHAHFILSLYNTWYQPNFYFRPLLSYMRSHSQNLSDTMGKRTKFYINKMHLESFILSLFQANTSKSSIGTTTGSMYSQQPISDENEHDIIESESDDDDDLIPKDANVKEIK